MMADDAVTPQIVQKQIDVLREQLFKLNEKYASSVESNKLRKGKQSEWTAEEHMALLRNETLRNERNKLMKELNVKDPPEVLEKKNVLKQLSVRMDELRKEIDRLVVMRDSKQQHAKVVLQRQKDLQSLQSAVAAEQSEFRQLQRELQDKVKEEERKLLAKHSKAVKLGELSKYGVSASEAQRVTKEVATQQQVIADMEKEVRLRKFAHDKALLRNNQPKKIQTQFDEQIQRLQEQVSELEDVLKSREVELKKSYDHVGVKGRPKKVQSSRATSEVHTPTLPSTPDKPSTQ